jgi:hypothetical protein
MDEEQFYTYKNGSKTELCKKCLTMHIDNFDPETFLWILQKMDVPYIEEEWNVLRDRAYAKDPKKLNGMSVFGKYISKMKLKQWKQYSWADTEKFEAEKEERLKKKQEQNIMQEEELKAALARGDINEHQYKTFMSTDTLYHEAPIGGDLIHGSGYNYFDETQFMDEAELPDPAAELTEEDKMYLAMKWGRTYKPSEWVELERNYNEMMNSFDIQDADTINTLILLCKTTLKQNQAIDCGDIDGFQKLSRVSESLRKTAKFTAAQNKDQKSDAVDSIGEIVIMCERDGGFIPRYATDIPQDKVDLTLKDMNNYLNKLVTQDLGFGQQIEDSLKKIQIQREMREQEEDDDNDVDIFSDNYVELEDEDFEDFYENVNEQKEKDMKVMFGEEDN